MPSSHLLSKRCYLPAYRRIKLMRLFALRLAGNEDPEIEQVGQIGHAWRLRETLVYPGTYSHDLGHVDFGPSLPSPSLEVA